MKKFVGIMFFWLVAYVCDAQLLFFQDSFKGGVAVDGVSYFSMDYLVSDTINFQITAPTSIRKAFLLSYRLQFGTWFTALRDNSIQVNFNGNLLTFDSSDIVTPEFHPDPSLNSGKVWIVAKDVTSYTQSSANFLITPDQNILLAGDTSRHFALDGFILCVEYDDPLAAVTNTCIYLNDKTYENPLTHNLSGMNPIDNSKDVALSAWCGDMFSFPYNYVATFTINTTLGNFYLGALDDYIGNSNHTKTLPGSFTYSNNLLSGLVDDTPDSLIGGSDALANIKNYILNGTTNYSVTSVGHLASNGLNDWMGYMTAYSSPCPPVPRDSTKIYAICAGATAQLKSNDLNAQSYLWSPAIALTSTISSSPAANPNSSTNYILTVTDSNGCHHTEFHKVLVYPIPKASGASVVPAICGESLGTATINPVYGTPPYQYNIGNGFQSNTMFSNLSPMAYTVAIKDSLGCQTQTTFTIGEINQANASFNVDPNVVCFPNNPYIYNTSGSINNYSWYVNNVFQTSSHYPSLSFSDTGTYLITLIGYHNLSQCSDTVTRTVVIKDCPPDSISVEVPNIFTPNGDGINDTWQPIINSYGYELNNYSVTVFDRWGIKVFELSMSSTQSGWDGRNTSGIACTEGTYFYLVSYRATNGVEVKEETLKGYLQLSK